MSVKGLFRAIGRGATAAGVFAAAGYGTYAALTWSRYGKPSGPRSGEEDEILDRFVPVYDVVERHHVAVVAPADVTLDVARNLDLSSHPVVRAVFRGRELILGAAAVTDRRPKGLVAEVLSLGWVVLAEVPGREIVLGCVTRPWEPDVTFRSIAPEQFATFNEPAYVKIAWTLRADPIDAMTSVFRTETRAVATDHVARRRFRLYWSFLSPGIWLIRRMALGPVRREAERRTAA